MTIPGASMITCLSSKPTWSTCLLGASYKGECLIYLQSDHWCISLGFFIAYQTFWHTSTNTYHASLFFPFLLETRACTQNHYYIPRALRIHVWHTAFFPFPLCDNIVQTSLFCTFVLPFHSSIPVPRCALSSFKYLFCMELSSKTLLFPFYYFYAVFLLYLLTLLQPQQKTLLSAFKKKKWKTVMFIKVARKIKKKK